MEVRPFDACSPAVFFPELRAVFLSAVDGTSERGDIIAQVRRLFFEFDRTVSPARASVADFLGGDGDQPLFLGLTHAERRMSFRAAGNETGVKVRMHLS